MSSSNIDDVEAAFDDLFDLFGFDTRMADGKTVGDAITLAIAEDIHASPPQDPDGNPWPENSDTAPGYYKSRKKRKYGSDVTGYRTGQMLSRESLCGEPEIGRDEMTMTYGTGKPPSHGEDGLGFDADEDGKVTDREKAEYFSEKVGAFYGLNERREEEATAVIREGFANRAREKFGTGG